MAERFLTKTVVDRAELLPLGEGSAIEAHDRLRAALEGRVSPAAAALFAEPLLSRGNADAPATVSWYVDGTGDARRLGGLSADGQEVARAALSGRLAELRPLLSDPDLGPLLGPALHLRGMEDIWVVDGQPVLTNWGILPGAAAQSRASRDAHFASTLGPLIGMTAAPPLAPGEIAEAPPQPDPGPVSQAPAPAAAGMGAASMAAAGAGAAQSARAATDGGQGMADTNGPGEGTPPEGGRSAWHWVPLLILLLLFGAILIWLLLPGTRIFPPTPPPRVVDDSAAAALIEESNRALEERARQLEEAIAGAVCTPEGDLLLPNGRLPDGTMPPVEGGAAPEGGASLQPDSLIPPRPQDVSVPQEVPEQRDDGTQASRQSATDLLTLIEQQTALVLVQGSEAGTGSGFFVGPDLLVTNYHVIAPALSGGQIYVTNESLGGVRQASVLAHDGPLEVTGGDYALLRVENAAQPFYTLRSSEDTMRLQNIIAAGYPGAVLETDANFSALVAGDASAIPPATVTDGIVNVEQDLGPGTRVLIHTATISPGNSGGPLVDYCGRVVGVNTFGRTSDSRQLNFALASTDLLRFLDGTPAAPTSNGSACSPVPIGAAGEPPAGEGETPAEDAVPDGEAPEGPAPADGEGQ